MEGKTFKYNNGKIAPPEKYLGARLKRNMINGNMCWNINSCDYVIAAVQTIKNAITKKPWKMPKAEDTPTTKSFVPELYGTEGLGYDGIQFYQEMIGILRWATELGRTYILHEVSILSQYQAAPKEGHIEEILHIFAFLYGKPRLTLYMDPAFPRLNYSVHKNDPSEFKEYYIDAEENMPHNMPRPRGRSVLTSEFVDTSHGANKVTRRSHSCYVLFINRAPVTWISKRQQTVETSTFSSEFIVRIIRFVKL